MTSCLAKKRLKSIFAKLFMLRSLSLSGRLSAVRVYHSKSGSKNFGSIFATEARCSARGQPKSSGNLPLFKSLKTFNDLILHGKRSSLEKAAIIEFNVVESSFSTISKLKFSAPRTHQPINVYERRILIFFIITFRNKMKKQ